MLARHLLLPLFLLAACGQVAAQTGGGHRGGEGRSRQEAGAEPAEVTRMSPNDQVRMQLNGVRAALRLSPAQGAAWQVYEDRVIELLEDMARVAESPAGEGALKQIDRKVDLARNRLAALEDLSDAAKKLYASLSGEQKATAERMLPGTVPALYAGQAIRPQGERRPRGTR
jgi:hypothetical protein